MLKDIENLYQEVAGYDMSYAQIKEICRKACEEDCNLLYLDGSEKRDQGRCCICIDGRHNIYRMYSSDEAFLN